MWFPKKIVSSFSLEEMHILETRFSEGQTWLLLASEEELRQEFRKQNNQKEKEGVIQERELQFEEATAYTEIDKISNEDFIRAGGFT